MRLTLCLEGNTEGRVLASVDMEEIEKQIREEIKKELWELPNEYSEKLYKIAYEQGRADKYQEIVSEYMLLTEKQVAEIRTDAIDECKYKIVDSLEKQLGCKVCSSYEEKYHCSKCKMQEIINLTVDILEQLKEQK